MLVDWTAYEGDPCPGGVVLSWSKYLGEQFNHYTTLRSSSPEIPLPYPPQGGAVDPGGTYATDPYKTSAVDTDLSAVSTYYYRTMAFDAEDRVIAASPSKGVAAQAVGELGGLAVGGQAGALEFGWSPFGESADCFTWYKLVYSASDPEPSYLKGSQYLWAGSEPWASRYSDSKLGPGTYFFRLQVIRATSLGKFVVSQTGVIQFEVLPPNP